MPCFFFNHVFLFVPFKFQILVLSILIIIYYLYYTFLAVTYNSIFTRICHVVPFFLCAYILFPGVSRRMSLFYQFKTDSCCRYRLRHRFLCIICILPLYIIRIIFLCITSVYYPCIVCVLRVGFHGFSAGFPSALSWHRKAPQAL